jgi:hypothetical protein
MSHKIKTSVEVDGYLSADHLKISTSSAEPVDVGEIVWNQIDGTFDMGLIGGVTLQAGQEMHMYGKATESISNGDAVMFAGVQGDHILIAKADAATINNNPEYFIGIATQNFSTNDFGYITVFGNVRGLNTTSYTLGTVLYYNSASSTDGLLTSTAPTAPNAKIEVAAVVRVHATQGILLVRPHVMPKVKDLQDVYAPSASNNDGLFWNTSNNRYESKSIVSSLGYTPVPTTRTITINGSTQDLSVNRTFNIDTGVTSFNTRTGSITLSSGDVTGALGYTPYNASNPAGYISSYTETDTLATVTARGASTNTAVTLSSGGNTFNGHHYFSAYDANGNHYPHYNPGSSNNGSKLNLRMFDNSGNVVLFYLNGSDKSIQWNGNNIWHAGNLTNLNQLINGPGYITSFTETDPTVPSHVKSITTTNISNWNTAFSWGNHTTAGYITQTTGDSRYIMGTTSPGTVNNFTISIGNNGSYSYVQSHSSQPLELNPLGNDVKISGNIALHAGNYSTYAVPTSRTITINGTTQDLSANRSFTVTAVETDTLATVTARGALSSGNIFTPVNGGVFFNGNGLYGSGVYGSGNDLWFNAGSVQRASLNSSGDFTANSSLRSPIFYDSNNTGYYLDPASTSVIRKTNIVAIGSGWDDGLNLYSSDVTNRWNLLVDDGASDSLRFAFNNTERFRIDTNGVVNSLVEHRAPIFYDSNDTAFYLDPATSSFSSVLNGTIRLQSGAFGTNSRSNSSQGPISRTFAPQGAANSFQGGNVTGAIKIRLPFRANDCMWSMKVRIYEYTNDATSEYTIGNYSYSAGAYHRGAYYIGGVGSSPQTVRFGNDGSFDCVWIGETGKVWSHPVVGVVDFMGGYVRSNVETTSNNWDITFVSSFNTIGDTVTPSVRFSNVSATSVSVDSAMYSPIYYDSNNTGFYVDPASTSVLNGLTVSGYELVRARTQGNWSGTGVIDNVVGILAWKNYGNNHVIFDASQGTSPSGTGVSQTNSAIPWSASYPTLMGWNGANTYGVRVDSARVADVAGSAPNGSNANSFYNVTPGDGNGLRFWESNSYKISMGVGGLYQYGPVTDYSIKMQMDQGSTGRGFTWGREGIAPIAALNSTSGNMQIAGNFTTNQVQFSTSINGGRFNGDNSWGAKFFTSDGYIWFGPANGGHAHIYTDRPNFYLNAPITVNGGSIMNTSDIRSTIFYDNNNTGYYLDPNGVSNLYESNFGDNSSGNQGINIYYGNQTSGYGKIRFYQSSGNHQTIHSFSANWQGGGFGPGNSANAINIDGAAGVTFGGWNVPDAYIAKNGNFWCRYDVIAYSDERVKNNIEVIKNALGKIKEVRGVTFTRNDYDDKEKRHTGVIAQEILKVLPEAVTEDSDGMYSVSYGNLAGLFIEAIKEQQTQIEELKQLVNQLIKK